jgi:hypothetical protein
VDVTASQSDQFGGPQSGLDGQQDQRVVAASGPGVAIGAGEQGVGLDVGEERDDRLVGSLGWDRQNPFDVGGVFGVTQRGEGKQRVDRGQSGVAGPDAVASLVLQVVEERGDGRCVQIGEVQAGGEMVRRCPAKTSSSRSVSR